MPYTYIHKIDGWNALQYPIECMYRCTGLNKVNAVQVFSFQFSTPVTWFNDLRSLQNKLNTRQNECMSILVGQLYGPTTKIMRGFIPETSYIQLYGSIMHAMLLYNCTIINLWQLFPTEYRSFQFSISISYSPPVDLVQLICTCKADQINLITKIMLVFSPGEYTVVCIRIQCKSKSSHECFNFEK